MIPVIFYSHNLIIYNTEREQEELRRLQEYFSNGIIYNPNRPFIQRNKNPMQICLKIIKDSSITGIAFSHDGKNISLGVFAEIRLAQKIRKPVYIIDQKRIHSYSGTLQYLKKDRATNWAKV